MKPEILQMTETIKIRCDFSYWCCFKLNKLMNMCNPFFQNGSPPRIEFKIAPTTSENVWIFRIDECVSNTRRIDDDDGGYENGEQIVCLYSSSLILIYAISVVRTYIHQYLGTRTHARSHTIYIPIQKLAFDSVFRFIFCCWLTLLCVFFFVFCFLFLSHSNSCSWFASFERFALHKSLKC